MYTYETERPKLFTDEGQRLFLRVRDHAQKLLAASGAVTCEKLLAGAGAGAGASFVQLACIDRLVELGELRRVTPVGSCATRNEVFVRGRS